MDMSESYRAAGAQSEWMTTREAAALLFGGVKMRTLQLWAKKGKIPAVQSPGGTWRFHSLGESQG